MAAATVAVVVSPGPRDSTGSKRGGRISSVRSPTRASAGAAEAVEGAAQVRLARAGCVAPLDGLAVAHLEEVHAPREPRRERPAGEVGHHEGAVRPEVPGEPPVGVGRDAVEERARGVGRAGEGDHPGLDPAGQRESVELVHLVPRERRAREGGERPPPPAAAVMDVPAARPLGAHRPHLDPLRLDEDRPDAEAGRHPADPEALPAGVHVQLLPGGTGLERHREEGGRRNDAEAGLAHAPGTSKPGAGRPRAGPGRSTQVPEEAIRPIYLACHEAFTHLCLGLS